MNLSRSLFLSLPFVSALACAGPQSATLSPDTVENTSEHEADVSITDKRICNAVQKIVHTVAPSEACEMRFLIPGEASSYSWEPLSKEEALSFFRQLSLRQNLSHLDDPEEKNKAIDSIYQFYADVLDSNKAAVYRMYIDLDLDGKKEPLVKLDRTDLHRCTDGPDQHGPAQFFFDVTSPSQASIIKPNISHGRLTMSTGIPYFISWYDFPESLVVSRRKLSSPWEDREVSLTTICSYSF